MAGSKVLITTSGIGSRLGEITSYTNKSLVRVGSKPAISHIIESYPEDTSFVITLGHFGNQVKDLLKIAYPSRLFEFVEVDMFEGEGSSLGYSILQAKNLLQCPFIFHACDTIIFEKQQIEAEHNWLAGSMVDNSSHYRTLLIENEIVTKINEKGDLNFDFSYIGLCKIWDYQIFWAMLEKEDFTNQQLSDCHVINNMIHNANIKFRFKETKNWLDIGNASSLKKTRETITCEFEILDKLEESIFFIEDHVIKFFFDKNICHDRIERAKLLSGLVPPIVDNRENFYAYQLQPGIVFSKTADRLSFRNFLIWCKANLWQKTSINKAEFRNLCYDFYYEKTKKRTQKYLDASNAYDVNCTINGEAIPQFFDMLNMIDWDWLTDGIQVSFHGDLILDNILQTKNGFCLLDWRQNFGSSLETGDMYYDLAKLNHSLIFNHALVKQNLFIIEKNGNNFFCEILCSSRLIECKEILHNFAVREGLDRKKINMITALIWINMAPLHEYPMNRFLFNFGKYNLYKTLCKED